LNLKRHIRRLVNEAWIAAGSREHARFSAALGRVAATQSDHLFRLLRRNAATCFGTRHRFAQIRSVSEYQERVPVTGFDALAGCIESIARGEDGVLTADRVRLFQPTSGSSSATKLIPWTAGLGREFHRGITPWLVALYRRKPALLRGTAYWSISPPTASVRKRGRLRVGFDHDAEYLGFFGRQLFSLVSAVPPGVARCRDMHEFKTRTLVSLLADENLALISIWSPTFLTTLLDDFLARRGEILELLNRNGGAGARRRAEYLRGALPEGAGQPTFERVWPNLQLISCWTHGPSGLYANHLRNLFPGVEIQGKGLVATEAFVSLPFDEGHDPVLAVNSHFFEFQDTAGDRLLLAHQLVAGNTYRVIVTTGGGLYRYPLGDVVRVTDFIQDAPCLRFVGREGSISDLFGEKLHGVFVAEAVQRVLAGQAIKARFALLAPTAGPVRPAYALFLDADAIPNAAVLRDDLERELGENFHYTHCRRLGQLSGSRVFQIHRGAVSAEAVFQREMLSRGLKLGDIKMMPLDRQPGWEERFSGCFVA
jgi:hypothetical protein